MDLSWQIFKVTSANTLPPSQSALSQYGTTTMSHYSFQTSYVLPTRRPSTSSHEIRVRSACWDNIQLSLAANSANRHTHHATVFRSDAATLPYRVRPISNRLSPGSSAKDPQDSVRLAR